MTENRKRHSKRIAAIPATGLFLWSASALPTAAQNSDAEMLGAAMGGLIGLLILVVIGAIVGWLASLIVKGTGSGFFMDVLIGIGGSILAGRVLPMIGLPLGGWVGSFIAAVIGAVILILVVRLIRKAAG